MRREIMCPVCGAGMFGVSVEDSAHGNATVLAVCTSCGRSTTLTPRVEAGKVVGYGAEPGAVRAIPGPKPSGPWGKRRRRPRHRRRC